ncbi:MAG TPA: efflux RND transporter periplasmic adaptor subunit [Acidobacteriota bacterium]|nr:efflux RND transporter periplasmic adaptor subunit [Acidobacteriota bacterium]
MKYVLYLLPLVALLACGGKETSAPAQSGAAPARTARVEKAPGVLEISGTVRAADVAQLASRYGGFVREVKARAGSRVKAGDLLVVLDDRSLQAQADKVQAGEQEVRQAIEEARQHLQAADTQRQLTTNTLVRIQSLYDKKSASRQEFEEAQAAKDAAEAGWRAAQERVAQAESKLRQAKSDTQDVSASMSYQRITAPFDGVVTSMTADQGTFITPGQTVAAMENPRRYQLVFSVEQELLSALPAGSKIQVQVPAAGAVPLDATIDEVSPSADQATRTYLVKAGLPANASLQTGLSGRAVIHVPSRSSLWIPAAFLAQQNDLETVIVKTGNDWRRVLVKSGDRSGDRVEILSGLNEGDEVGLFEGQQ